MEFISWRGKGFISSEEFLQNRHYCDRIVNTSSHRPGGFPWCSSADPSARGAHQKVITYSLFGTENNYGNSPVSDLYNSQLRSILIAVDKQYPGWIVRIYQNFHGENQPENILSKQLYELHCQFNHLDLCSLTEMIDFIPQLTPIDPALLRGLNGRMFRFLVMLDPNVDVSFQGTQTILSSCGEKSTLLMNGSALITIVACKITPVPPPWQLIILTFCNLSWMGWFVSHHTSVFVVILW